MDELTVERLAQARGAPVFAGGERVGQVESIFYDNETRAPEWIGIGSDTLGKRVLVPLEDARLEQDGIHLPYAPEVVASAPPVESDRIEMQTEQMLLSHFRSAGVEQAGVEPAAELRTEVSPPVESMTRAEEELVVGKRPVEAGRVRLRKWVETEPVSIDVELERETIRVVRETVNQVVDAEVGEAEIEITLQAEEPVVQKHTVAKERISLAKDVETDVQTVNEEVRRERVEIEEEPRG